MFSRKLYFLLFLLILVSSCSGPFLRSSFTTFPETLSYCNLLHVSSGPYLASQPKPFLGISFSSEKLKNPVSPFKCNTAIKVTSVIDGTPAMKAGLKENDIILSLNGEPVCQNQGDILTSFRKMIERQRVGSIVEMDILRGNRRLIMIPKLIERPTHRQPESNHQNLHKCSGHSSMLEAALSAQNALPLFYSIYAELDQQSDTIHNLDWFYKKRYNPFQLKEMTYMIRHPIMAGVVAKELSGQLMALAHEKHWQMEDMLQRLTYLLDVELSPSSIPIEVTFPGLIQAIKETGERIDQSLRHLSKEERVLLRDKVLKPWNDNQWNTILEISLKIDLKKLFEAFYPLLPYLASNNLSLLKKDLLHRFKHKKGTILFEAMTPIGRVIVGGLGTNVYQEDAALILDLGGDDLYLNNAGGTRLGIPVAVVIDWEGNDRYLTKENFSQGSGILGGGFLLDFSGSDTFSSSDGGQGVGFFGIGFLYHEGGNSVYKARSFSQGVGQMGIGLIWNRDGNNLYLCSQWGQALGLFRGAGILMDEAGKDYYQLGGLQPDFRDPLKSTVSMGQGFGHGLRPDKEIKGVSGGIGILIDEAGDDTYIADYFAQGSSYYYSVGILNDLAGNDQYISGRYAQGAGIHSTVGVFIDQKGNDFYYTSFGVAQGLGHDYGVGFFEDSQGDDQYWGGTLVQGAATRGGLGILIDLYGKDHYTSSESGQAFAQDEDCIGILIDAETTHDLINNHKDSASIRLGLKKAP